MIDLRRLIDSDLYEDKPVMLPCPLHTDPSASLAVYEDHLYCYGGCGYFRRYAGAALLLGLWNGEPETELEAVRAVKSRLPSSSSSENAVVTRPPRPLDPHLPDTFHRFLLSDTPTLKYFMEWRGLTYQSVERWKLGWTGTHFTIPIYSQEGLVSVRYRRDDRLYDGEDTPKYQGVRGHNGVLVFDMRRLCQLLQEVWIVEGEYDAMVGEQLGATTFTLTNGAGRLATLPERLGVQPLRWVIATDQDEAGEKAAWELHRLLGSKAERARFAGKDLSEFAKRGGKLADIDRVRNKW